MFFRLSTSFAFHVWLCRTCKKWCNTVRKFIHFMLLIALRRFVKYNEGECFIFQTNKKRRIRFNDFFWVKVRLHNMKFFDIKLSKVLTNFNKCCATDASFLKGNFRSNKIHIFPGIVQTDKIRLNIKNNIVPHITLHM